MRYAVAVVTILALAGDAGAKGLPPGTSSLHFRQGHPGDIVAGTTFGLLVSHDSGATWQWMCDAAIGDGGVYDPDYSYSQSGAIFATAFMGLAVARDSCTFTATPVGTTFMTQDALGPDDALYAASADTNDARVFKSTDDGAMFTPSPSFGQAARWQTLTVAPGNANNVFLSGYRYVPACDQSSPTPLMACDPASPTDCKDAMHTTGTCANQRVVLLFTSVDGGASFTALPGSGQFVTQTTSAGLTTTANSAIDLVGVSRDGGTLYARVTYEDPTAVSDGLYNLDTAAGTPWTHMLSLADSMSVLLRSNGDLVVGTRSLGAQVLPSGASTFIALTSPPHINCLAEDPADDSVWACTQNDADGYAIMKTADLSTWSGVLSYQAIQAPVTCAAGTVQHDTCEKAQWCDLKSQLGITSTAIDCSAVDVDGPADAGNGGVGPTPSAGCCDTGNGGASTALLGGLAVGVTLLVRRRKRKQR